MNKKSDVQTNKIKISEDVVSKIVEMAVESVDGVSGLTKSKIRFGSLFTKSGDKSAVDINAENGAVDITVNVNVDYSCKVTQVTERIQNKVKNDVQNMAGIVVTKVNVIVENIEFDDKKN
jgi:uncharacterized alkaline shock family protein YloU